MKSEFKPQSLLGFESMQCWSDVSMILSHECDKFLIKPPNQKHFPIIGMNLTFTKMGVFIEPLATPGIVSALLWSVITWTKSIFHIRQQIHDKNLTRMGHRFPTTDAFSSIRTPLTSLFEWNNLFRGQAALCCPEKPVCYLWSHLLNVIWHCNRKAVVHRLF